MTPTDALKLCRYVRAACPQQKFDEYTPDAWADLLSDLRITDCIEAVKNLARRQPFIAPSEVRAEVRAIRTKRLEGVDAIQPPPELDGVGYVAWRRELVRRLGDGEHVEAARIGSRSMPAIAGVFREVPHE